MWFKKEILHLGIRTDGKYLDSKKYFERIWDLDETPIITKWSPLINIFVVVNPLLFAVVIVVFENFFSSLSIVNEMRELLIDNFTFYSRKLSSLEKFHQGYGEIYHLSFIATVGIGFLNSIIYIVFLSVSYYKDKFFRPIGVKTLDTLVVCILISTCFLYILFTFDFIQISNKSSFGSGLQSGYQFVFLAMASSLFILAPITVTVVFCFKIILQKGIVSDDR